MEKKYRNLRIVFDMDKMQDLKNRVLGVQILFLGIFLLIGGIVFVLFLYLLTGMFRESASIYKMIRIHGTNTVKTRILTL